jgi:Fe-S cluster assembly protein SufD
MLGSDTNHIDYHANVNHKIGNSVSNFLCRSLLKDKARGVFNGKILVEENASGTSATLNNNNLLLSDLAAMQSNPQLEINCEDVKCAHGSTSGNLDQDALFYLCSRGISISKAHEILIKGFTSKLLDSFDTVDLSLDQQIKDWIENE